MSGRHWTPYELEIILHHAHSLAPFDRETAPLYPPTIQNLMELGYFKRIALSGTEEAVGGYSNIRPTEKCMVFVELLLRTPEPRNVWLDPRDSKEIMPERTADFSRATPPPDGTITAAPGWTMDP